MSYYQHCVERFVGPCSKVRFEGAAETSRARDFSPMQEYNELSPWIDPEQDSPAEPPVSNGVAENLEYEFEDLLQGIPTTSETTSASRQPPLNNQSEARSASRPPPFNYNDDVDLKNDAPHNRVELHDEYAPRARSVFTPQKEAFPGGQTYRPIYCGLDKANMPKNAVLGNPLQCYRKGYFYGKRNKMHA